MSLLEDAESVAPYLEWIESPNPMVPPGRDADFCGACVGLVGGQAATVTLARLGSLYVSEIIVKRGHYTDPEGERTAFLTAKAADTAAEAWGALREMAEMVASFEDGLAAAEDAAPPRKKQKSGPQSIVSIFQGEKADDAGRS